MPPKGALAVAVSVALLVLPVQAAAQKDAFVDSFIAFHNALAGRYGDEGAAVTAALARMASSLSAWEQSQTESEAALKARAGITPGELALFYAEHARFEEAIRATAAAIAPRLHVGFRRGAPATQWGTSHGAAAPGRHRVAPTPRTSTGSAPARVGGAARGHIGVRSRVGAGRYRRYHGRDGVVGRLRFLGWVGFWRLPSCRSLGFVRAVPEDPSWRGGQITFSPDGRAVAVLYSGFHQERGSTVAVWPWPDVATAAAE